MGTFILCTYLIFMLTKDRLLHPVLPDKIDKSILNHHMTKELGSMMKILDSVMMEMLQSVVVTTGLEASLQLAERVHPGILQQQSEAPAVGRQLARTSVWVFRYSARSLGRCYLLVTLPQLRRSKGE